MDKTASKEITLKEAFNSLKQLVQFLLRKWLFVLLFAIVGGIIGIVYAWIQTPKYEAVLTFSTDDEANTAGGLLGLASQFGFNIGGGSGAFSGENIVTLIRSQKIIKDALLSTVADSGKQTRLLNLYMNASGYYKGLHKSDKYKNLYFPEDQSEQNFSRVQDSILLVAIDKMSKSVLSVEKPDDHLNLYKVSCISESEIFSKEFTERVMKKVSDFYIDTKTKRSLQTVNILQGRADSIRKEYNAALYGRASLSDANINPAFQTPTVGIQRKQTDITVLATAYGEVIKNLEIAKFTLLQQTPVVQVVDEPMYPLKIIKPGRLLTGIITAIAFAFAAIVWLILKRLLTDENSAGKT